MFLTNTILDQTGLAQYIESNLHTISDTLISTKFDTLPKLLLKVRKSQKQMILFSFTNLFALI